MQLIQRMKFVFLWNSHIVFEEKIVSVSYKSRTSDSPLATGSESVGVKVYVTMVTDGSGRGALLTGSLP
jgi:hypothetical protein